jgi:hypothetical protein
MSGQLAADAVGPPTRCADDRHACEVQTTCQPPSAWVKDPWPAIIRAIGNSGLSLTLNRRFERGSGLAIELPAETGSNTVLARVVQVAAHPVGWLLACTFIGELSDEEVQLVLNLDSIRHAEQAEISFPSAVQNVLFQSPVRPGDYLRWFVKRLELNGEWPLPDGKVVSFRVGSLSEAPPVEMKVRNCQRFGSYWVVECKLLVIPPDEVLQALIGASPD